jgi:hypothetical protein
MRRVAVRLSPRRDLDLGAHVEAQHEPLGLRDGERARAVILDPAGVLGRRAVRDLGEGAAVELEARDARAVAAREEGVWHGGCDGEGEEEGGEIHGGVVVTTMLGRDMPHGAGVAVIGCVVRPGHLPPAAHMARLAAAGGWPGGLAGLAGYCGQHAGHSQADRRHALHVSVIVLGSWCCACCAAYAYLCARRACLCIPRSRCRIHSTRHQQSQHSPATGHQGVLCSFDASVDPRVPPRARGWVSRVRRSSLPEAEPPTSDNRLPAILARLRPPRSSDRHRGPRRHGADQQPHPHSTRRLGAGPAVNSDPRVVFP